MNFMHQRNSMGATGVGMAMIAAAIGVGYVAVAMTRGLIWAGAATARTIRNRRQER